MADSSFFPCSQLDLVQTINVTEFQDRFASGR